MGKISNCFFIWLFVFLFPIFLYAQVGQPIYGIITALDSERTPFLHHMHDKKRIVINKVPYIVGNFEKHRIVLVATGMGSLSAAIITSSLIRDFHPRAVIFSGIAGGMKPYINVGDVVVGNKLYALEYVSSKIGANNEKALHNVMANSINQKIQPVMISGSNYLLQLTQQIEQKNNFPFKIFYGLIGSTNYFPAPISEIIDLKKKNGDAIDMEGYAVAFSCWLFNTPSLIVRGISDQVIKPKQVVTDKMRTANITIDGSILAAKNAQQVVRNIISQL